MATFLLLKIGCQVEPKPHARKDLFHYSTIDSFFDTIAKFIISSFWN